MPMQSELHLAPRNERFLNYLKKTDFSRQMTNIVNPQLNFVSKSKRVQFVEEKQKEGTVQDFFN